METLIMKSAFGSTLYGTNTPESDMDYKGIFIPDARSLILGNAKTHYSSNTSNKNQKNTADDIDLEMYSLKYFIELAIKGETIALDMIHTPSNMIVDYDLFEPWDFIHKNRAKFYTTDMKAYLGYVRKQASKYGIKGTRVAAMRLVWEAIENLPIVKPNPGYRGFLATTVEDIRKELPINEYCKFVICPKTGNEFYEVMGSKHQLTIKLKEFKQKIQIEWEKYGERARLAEKNEGVDWKAMHHAIRGGQQLREIYETGDLLYPLKEKEYLKDIKAGKIDFKEISEYLEELVADVDRLSIQANKNGMPAKVDTSFWENFVFDVYHDHIKKHLK